MIENTNKDLASKLKELRKAFCMTQDEIAEILDMSRTSFSKYENGATLPPLNVLRKLAKIYNIPIEYLIHDNEAFIVLNDGNNTEEPDLKNLSSYFAQLTPEERVVIMKLRLMEKDKKDDFLRRLNDEN